MLSNHASHALCLAILVLAHGLVPAAKAEIIVGPIVNPANAREYFLLTESSWQDAEAEAVALGGHLATINDSAEQDWVFSTFGSFGGVDRSLWIGLNDAASEGNFVWVSGEAVTYTNWLPGQPDDFGVGRENYVHMLRTGNGYGVAPGFWNDLASPNSSYPVFDPISGVVERAHAVPEPASLVMLGTSALVMLGHGWRRRRAVAA